MITYNYKYNSGNLDIYCLFCNTQTISSTGVKDCRHLIMLTTSESIDYPEYDKKKLIDKYLKISFEEDVHIKDYLKNILNDDYLFILREQQAPSHFEEYIIYSNI